MHLTEKIKERFVLMDLLFDSFYGLFPSTYSILKNKNDVFDAKNYWVMAFVKAKIVNEDESMNEDLFWKGFDLLPFLNQQFMPSCGQFIDLCIKGLPEKNVEI